jgi:hypothetical protein
MLEKILFTQKEAAKALGFKNYRSLNKLIGNGEIECIKRTGKNGRKLFTEAHIVNYIQSKMV